MTTGTADRYEHPDAPEVLVLGILSLVLCPVGAPLAWWFASRTLADIDGAPGRATNRGTVQAGRVCAMVGTGLLVGALVLAAATVLLRIAVR